MNTKCFVKKSMALLLIVLMLFSLLTTTAFANQSKGKSGADYPIVLVHGLYGWGADDGITDLLPYWGMKSGDMVAYLRSMGYTAYAASVGPISSVHDRCCELFAQLTGTRVDYGQAHADSCTAEYSANGYSLTHQRYGRDYSGKRILSHWGPIYTASGKVTGWYDSKINLVGHSFGGPTSLEFVKLLAEGDAQEQAWGKQQAALYGGDWHDYVSPLFWGDYNGEFLVHSVTSLAGVLNGTTFATSNADIYPYIASLSALIANSLGVSKLSAIYDCQLEQFGLSRIPGDDLSAELSYLSRKGFLSGHDHAFHELTIAGCNELKQSWDTYSNIYYFSYACNCSHQVDDVWVSDSEGVLPLLAVLARPMGSYTNADELALTINGAVYGCVDESWLPNDVMVNTLSSRYPFGAPHQDYDASNLQAGTWNVHSDLQESHFAIIGSLFYPDSSRTRAFFSGMAADIAHTTAISPAPYTVHHFLQQIVYAFRSILRHPLRLFGINA